MAAEIAHIINDDGTQAYAYFENSNNASSSVGIDGDDSDKLKISASTAVDVGPTTVAQITIDPDTNGNIVLVPNGSGTVNIDYATANTVALYGTSGALSETSAGTDGQVIIGATGAAPDFATLTSTDASITFTTGANTLDLSVASAGGLTWSVVTDATKTIVVSEAYFANNAGTLAFTLPATAAVGDTFSVAGMNNATGWSIAQNAGQTIHFGASDTTTGVGGSLASTGTFDVVEIVCNVANTDFVVTQSIGNITVV